MNEGTTCYLAALLAKSDHVLVPCLGFVQHAFQLVCELSRCLCIRKRVLAA